ncbi:unnamed protein product [Nezara viridula]|uniref:Ig-like domain-containing protein n=1 Tax=Nezara viridula TaxID=85310 RepID=A0A9P0HN99_NEZVI|nr:unnamed protein product [Nezara viridula]
MSWNNWSRNTSGLHGREYFMNSLKNDEDPLNLNNNTIWNLLKFQTNLYPQYLHGDSSLNDTIAIDEEFDHTGSQGSQEHPMEEMLEKMKEVDKVGRRRSRATQSSEDMPVFDNTLNTNVTAELGSTVYLSCRVTNLKNMTVGWIRMKDKHVLTYGIYSFAHDQRFQIRHREDPDDWKLLIKHVMKKDEGPYRCQVSNGTEVLSQNFNLLVAVPTARIIGAGEIRIKQGSAISLVCVIENVSNTE